MLRQIGNELWGSKAEIDKAERLLNELGMEKEIFRSSADYTFQEFLHGPEADIRALHELVVGK